MCPFDLIEVVVLLLQIYLRNVLHAILVLTTHVVQSVQYAHILYAACTPVFWETIQKFAAITSAHENVFSSRNNPTKT